MTFTFFQCSLEWKADPEMIESIFYVFLLNCSSTCRNWVWRKRKKLWIQLTTVCVVSQYFLLGTKLLSVFLFHWIVTLTGKMLSPCYLRCLSMKAAYQLKKIFCLRSLPQFVSSFEGTRNAQFTNCSSVDLLSPRSHLLLHIPLRLKSLFTEDFSWTWTLKISKTMKAFTCTAEEEVFEKGATHS